jgi:hypothetical protein
LLVRQRRPVVLEFLRESAQARSCPEILSARDFKCEISNLRFSNLATVSIKHGIERTSPAEARGRHGQIPSTRGPFEARQPSIMLCS